jgi:hypothetical protein
MSNPRDIEKEIADAQRMIGEHTMTSLTHPSKAARAQARGLLNLWKNNLQKMMQEQRMSEHHGMGK